MDVIDAGSEVEEAVADEALSDAVAVNDVRAIDLVEAPTSTVPVTLTRPSCKHRLTNELFFETVSSDRQYLSFSGVNRCRRGTDL